MIPNSHRSSTTNPPLPSQLLSSTSALSACNPLSVESFKLPFWATSLVLGRLDPRGSSISTPFCSLLLDLFFFSPLFSPISKCLWCFYHVPFMLSSVFCLLFISCIMSLMSSVLLHTFSHISSHTSYHTLPILTLLTVFDRPTRHAHMRYPMRRTGPIERANRSNDYDFHHYYNKSFNWARGGVGYKGMYEEEEELLYTQFLY